jgi:hypothetical protein
VEERPDITAATRERAGVWANAVEVIRGRHEFTLDFFRLDHAEQPPSQGVLVARVALSSTLMLALLDLLQAHWADYAAEALPREVSQDDEETEDPTGQGG